MTSVPRRLPASAVQHRNAFTLIELLVVLVIIVILTAIAVPIISSLSHGSRIRSASRTVQAMLAGARDRALATRQPRGVRFLVDAANGESVRSMVFVQRQNPLTGTCHVVRSIPTNLSSDPQNRPYLPRISLNVIDGQAQPIDGMGNEFPVNLVVGGPGVDFSELHPLAGGPGMGSIRFEHSGPIYAFRSLGLDTSSPPDGTEDAIDRKHLLLLGPVFPPSSIYSASLPFATFATEQLFDFGLQGTVGIHFTIPRGNAPTADLQPTALPSGVVIDVGQVTLETEILDASGTPTGFSTWQDSSSGLSKLRTPSHVNIRWPNGSVPTPIPYYDVMFSPSAQLIGDQRSVFDPPVKLWVRDQLSDVRDSVSDGAGGFLKQRVVGRSSRPSDHAIVSIHGNTGYVTTSPPFFDPDPNDASTFDFRKYYHNVGRGLDSGL